MITAKIILTDDEGNEVVASRSYDGNLTGKNLDEAEQLIFKAKADLAQEAEHALLTLNQTSFSEKKKPNTIKREKTV